ncbi:MULTISPECIES: WXG100 family type VII secretion target [Tomitella]|uniref:ESAT-6-like protein n=1 Tax=Tomitella fengzijianii TaxID=2597660 RepID=A0A516X5P7_9ACTN|nr:MULTISPECIES: WXG100 family type VII secretion target [Tomitella]QDQ98343.1 WXG100 family type VII secretion target [Tomitella fengzijianii]
MTGRIHYDFGGIEQSASEIDGHIAAFNGHKADLDTNVRTLLGSWEGEAQASYHAAQSKFDQAYVELTQVLQVISRKVKEGNDLMHETNARAAASWA